jgi:hypothetical protein
MTVGSINSSSASGAIDYRQAGPPPITKSGLEAMRDRITKDGGTVPTGLDTLIAKFDEAAGSSGKMTFAQFKTFAADNGVTLPEPGKGGKPGGMPPMGGGRPMAASGGGGTKASSSSKSSDDVSTATDEELRTMVAQGDAQAIRELKKREAAKTQIDGGETVSSAGTVTSRKAVGTNIDTYA